MDAPGLAISRRVSLEMSPVRMMAGISRRHFSRSRDDDFGAGQLPGKL